jgi:hypothetical protein
MSSPAFFPVDFSHRARVISTSLPANPRDSPPILPNVAATPMNVPATPMPNSPASPSRSTSHVSLTYMSTSPISIASESTSHVSPTSLFVHLTCDHTPRPPTSPVSSVALTPATLLANTSD